MGPTGNPKSYVTAPPPSSTEDASVRQARETQRMKELQRVSKRKNIYAGELGNNPTLMRPRAGSTLLGG